MAVKMRLMRMGKKRSPFYRVVVIDGRAPRDGRYIDLLGRYDPNQEPSLIEIDTDKAIDWLRKGAQPTEAVRKLLEISGAMSRYKVAAGKIHTVAPKAVPVVGDAPSGVAEPVEESLEPPTSDEVEEPTSAEAEADTAGDDAAGDGEEE